MPCQDANAVIINSIENFNIQHIFLCGQAFRYFEEKDGSFTHVAKGKVINLSQKATCITIKNTTPAEYKKIWENYFDVRRDIKSLADQLNKDNHIHRCISSGCGIRLLQQEPFEALISFIISQNNSIPNIRRVIERICEKYGNEILYNDKIYYSFPTIEQLSCASVSELRELKCGYRAEYIVQTVKRIVDEKIDLAAYNNLPSKVLCEFLQSFSGVGPKVADCVALFGFSKYDVFPRDTWIIKAMEEFYGVKKQDIDAFTSQYFGDMRGYAQQYLFYYKRG